MHLKTILAVYLVFTMKYTPPPLHMRKILLVLNEHHFCYVEVIKLQTSDNTIVSNEYNRLFLVNAHHLHYKGSRVDWIWYILLLILPFTLLK